MKTHRIVLILFVALLFSAKLYAQNSKSEKVSFKVFGNCPQCKERIEDACDIKGVKAAVWDVDSKQMVVIYNPSKISLEKIHEAIAACGHDTELKKADNEVYSKLPDCCLYREKPQTHHD